MSTNRHVVPRGDGWAVKAPGASRASGITRTQKEAINLAREIIENRGGGELVIHNTGGVIRAKDTVPQGNDSPTIKG